MESFLAHAVSSRSYLLPRITSFTIGGKSPFYLIILYSRTFVHSLLVYKLSNKKTIEKFNR